MIETGDITQTYVTDTILITNQSTTVTNFDQIARQIEAAYGLPVGSVRITSITINGISTNAGNGRRRRGELYRKKRQLSTCDQFGLARSAVQITMRIAYPRRCGVAPACKQRFLNNVLTLFNTFTSSFPATFIFANGRSVQLVLYPCRATGAFPFIVGGAGGAGITTTTRETGDITRTFVTNTILANNQSTTVVNFNQIARQIETAYGLPAGSVRIINIVIIGPIRYPGSSSRRRRGVLYRKKRQLPSCDQYGFARTAVQITMRIVYPRRCGFSPSCKQRFANVILARFNTFAPSFPVTFIFADGRSIQLVLFACTATGAFPLVVFAPAALRTTTRAPVCSLQWNPTGTTVAGDGTPGVGLQQLRGPEDVFVDPFNTLVIADTGNNRIQRWVIGAAQGVTVAGQTGGGAGAGANQLNQAGGVIVLPNAPVCSLQWNPAGTTVAGDGTAGVGAQQLNLPTDVFLASANTLFIVCTGASRVQRWTIGATQGVTVAGQADGSAGGNPNQFSNPTGVVVDRNGNIYVTDTGRSRIQRWPPGAAEGQTIAAGKIA
ncbi:unnamed protein product [Rotaria sordida]|uniref:NHL repeat containing protein n=1 Tax=Rotaria sordida TaxID=392033 RepID=A0A814M3T7_9BILA|nr:unnamed protein product [Rotaria sordida]